MNSTLSTILEILKYTIPGLIVLWATYLIVKKFTVLELQRKQLALLREGQDVTLKLRLQAYERLSLLMERMHPRTLLPRVYMPGMTVLQFQYSLTETIKTEFEHNLSQQIYVSRQVWQTVAHVKEQEIGMINAIAQTLNKEDDAKVLHTKIIEYLVSEEKETPVEIALSVINEEAKKVLSFASLN